MILLFGDSNDGVIGYLALLLLDREAPFVLLDPMEHGRGFELDWHVEDGQLCGELRCGDRVIPLSEVRSVFPREVYQLQTGRASRPGEVDPGWMLHAFVENAPVLVCNRFSACATNFSKVYQQQVIAAHGISTPLTLVTSVPDEARAFYERCGKRAIYKSVSGRRSIVRRMTDADLARLDHVRNCPTQFQEWVPGIDVRVHVVGRRLFVTEIVTDSIDYRYAGRDGNSRAMRPADLPHDLARRCLELSESLGLVMAGIDFRRSLDGRYYCLEANPNPGFTFYEQYTGQGIGDALADLLVSGAAA